MQLNAGVHKVLVIDDDPASRNSLCRALGGDYPVLTATYGERAVRTAQRAGPDAIVLHLRGGVAIKNGLTTFRRLRTSDMTKNIPVVMLTNMARSVRLWLQLQLPMLPNGNSTASVLEEPFSLSLECLRRKLKEMIDGE